MVKLQYVLTVLVTIFSIEETSAQNVQLSYSASDLILQRGVPLRGSRCRPIFFLDVCDCSGTIDYSTFSRLPLLRGLNFTNSRINGIFPEVFSPLRSLETVAVRSSSISVQVSRTDSIRPPIPVFRDLVFQNSTVSGLNRNALQDLSSLRTLSFNYTDIRNISVDVFSDLTNIRRLTIRSSRLTNFDFRLISNLTSLEYLAIYNVQTNSQINYNDFSSLPNLNTILFDPARYLEINFNSFRSLRVVEIVGNQRNNTIVNTIVQTLSRRGILYRFVQ